MTRTPTTPGATIPAVTSRTPRFGNRPLAMVLAMLALFAQLWVGQISTAHLGQMLSQQASWGDVCTVQAPLHTEDAPDGPQGHAMGSALSCPVCAVAGAGFTPGSVPATVARLQAEADYDFAFTSVPARAPRHANMRPPAQAPPTA